MSSKRQAKQARRMRRKARTDDTPQQHGDHPSKQRERRSRPSPLSWLSSALEEKPEALLVLLDTLSQFRARSYDDEASLLPPFAWQAGYALGAADHVLEQLNAPWFRKDWGATENENWLGQLRGGLDTFARICWCLRFGYTLAGVALARWFLERWTYNVAFSYNIPRADSENDASYINRVWAQHPMAQDEEHVGAYWSGLSELLHGRTLKLNSRDVKADVGLAKELRSALHGYVLRAAEIPLRQVRVCVSVLANERGIAADARAYLHAPVEFLPEAPRPPEFLSVFAPPFDFDQVTSKSAHTVTPWGNTYRLMVRRGAAAPLKLTGFHSWMSIEERWARFSDEARASFEAEAEQTAAAFDPAVLRGLLTQYRAITEMTELVATELEGTQRASALHTAASALESAWVLWLQDVDDSMIAMRCVLESTARARAHRLKPDQAKALEARGVGTTPHRWLEAAGWKRLAPFARALGEFSHIQERSRHDESRELLTAIQRKTVSGFEAHTGRAHALEEIARMLAHEVARTLDELNKSLSDQFRARILLESEAETEAQLSAWLDHAMQYRSHSFGQANYPMDLPDTSLPSDEVTPTDADAVSTPT